MKCNKASAERKRWGREEGGGGGGGEVGGGGGGGGGEGRSGENERRTKQLRMN